MRVGGEVVGGSGGDGSEGGVGGEVGDGDDSGGGSVHPLQHSKCKILKSI